MIEQHGGMKSFQFVSNAPNIAWPQAILSTFLLPLDLSVGKYFETLLTTNHQIDMYCFLSSFDPFGGWNRTASDLSNNISIVLILHSFTHTYKYIYICIIHIMYLCIYLHVKCLARPIPMYVLVMGKKNQAM